MTRAKHLGRGLVLVSGVFVLALLSGSADDKKDKPSPSGVWTLKAGETVLEFSNDKTVRIAPHGESNPIAVICEYTAGKDETVKAKVTDYEGSDEVKEMLKEVLPVGTEFTFKWKITGETAKLDEIKSDMAEHLRSHLEGEYSRKQ